MKEFFITLVQNMVDDSNNVSVSETLADGGGVVVYTVKVAANDIGKLIGKQGRNAQAIRTVMECISAKHRKRVIIDIVDPTKKRERTRV